MSYKSRYDSGDWKAECDLCGRLFKASKLRKRWDGYMVCSEDWETRQPQDFVKGVADIQVPPWSRPEPQDTFIFADFLACENSNLSLGFENFLLTESPTNTPLETES